MIYIIIFINFYINQEIISLSLNDDLWRIDVKSFLKVSIISLGLVFFATTSSFALVDASIYGGYIFSGKVEGIDTSNFKGRDYGVKAHYNTSVFPLMELGVGGYYQVTKYKYDVSSATNDLTRDNIGVDVNLILTIPIIHPYIRGTYSLWDKLKNSDIEYDDTTKFKGYGAGAGAEFTFFPFLRIFGEYMYEYTDHDDHLKSQSVNLGLKIDI